MKLEGQRWNGTGCLARTDRFRPRSTQSRDKLLLVGTVWHSRPGGFLSGVCTTNPTPFPRVDPSTPL